MTRPLPPIKRDRMIERFLRGENCDALANEYRVHKTLPALRAYTMGFTLHRSERERVLTDQGKAWLAGRSE